MVRMMGRCLFAVLFSALAHLSAIAQNRPATGPSEMSRAPVDGGEVEYEVRGEGEPVLLIHGSHVAASFLPIMDQGALQDYRLIRYHRRGFAGSSDPQGAFDIRDWADGARGLLDYLGVERAHVIGHSYGAVIALQLAADASELVHSLVLLEPPLSATHPEALMARYESGDREGAVDAFMSSVAGPEWQSQIGEVVPGGPQQAMQDAATFFELEIPALTGWNFGKEDADRVGAPILYVYGSEGFGPNSLAREWWPRMEEREINGVDHRLQMQDPENVAEAVAAFLRRHPF